MIVQMLLSKAIIVFIKLLNFGRFTHVSDIWLNQSKSFSLIDWLSKLLENAIWHSSRMTGTSIKQKFIGTKVACFSFVGGGPDCWNGL